ncbi:hypothetical protein ARMSODRAFT_1018075 [Armillaria solidipes]|uniref:Uncharacterized protein n=1 Tax=Armillaria solidipes TaxID=1076256 RepID=A0A2H3BNQ2_9AGAR|nr:hypothetical protein ARMSODRAFT_1018075 [Armillaria solidipes]
MDTFCSFGLKCALCHHVLDFLSTVDHRTLDGKTFVFGNVWSLECGHLVDSDCAYQLLEHRTMQSLLPRPRAIPAHAFPVAKVWHCPERSCIGIYRSVYSHRSHGWTLAPDSGGHIKAMVPYAAVHQFLGPLALHFAPIRGTLGDLERFGLKLSSLRQGIRGRWWPTAAPVAVEYMTNQSLTHFPPIVVSISSTIASLSGSVENGYLIDALVAETLANRPPAPQWPSHLDSFRDSLDTPDLYSHNLVLVAPGVMSLNPEERFKDLVWVLPRMRVTPTPSSPRYFSEEERSRALDIEAAQILLSLHNNIRINRPPRSKNADVPRLFFIMKRREEL